MPERSDALKRNLKKYFEAGSTLSASISKMSRADLERALRGVARPGSDAREKVEDTVEEVWVRSQRGAEKLLDLVRTEIYRDFDKVVGKHREELSDLAERATRLFGAVVGHSLEDDETTTEQPSTTKATAAKQGGTRRAPAKKAPAKRATPAKATPTTKATAAKSPNAARKSPPVTQPKASRAKSTAQKTTPAKKATAAKTGVAPRRAAGGQATT
jgi:hypothetical protein